MIHQLIFAGPKPGMSEEEFQHYWVEVHALKYASKIPQIRRYLIDTRIPNGDELNKPLFGGVAELWFENEKEQLASLQSREFLEGARKDEPKWAAFWNTLVLDTTTHVLKEGKAPNKDSTWVKMIVLVKRKSGMSLEDFRKYSLNTHAQIALRLPGLRRYVQCHVRDSSYDIGEARFDCIYQLWFDDLQAIERMKASEEYMDYALSDLANFVDMKYFFPMITKEHWIIDKEAIEKITDTQTTAVIDNQTATIMDTQTTARVVAQWYKELAQGNIQAVLDGFSDDVVFEIPKTEYNQVVPWVGLYVGRKQVSEAFRLRDESIILESFEPRDFIVQNDRAVAFIYERSTHKSTGETFELNIVQVLRVSKGKISEWKAYYDPCPIIAAFQGDLHSRLLDAVENDNAGLTSYLLVQGASANARADATGLTALMVAACHGNSQIAKLLLDHGADPLTVDSKTGATALHKACQGGNVEVARMLVDAGAFVDAVTPTMGHTPIMDALWYKWPDMVRFLVDNGANLNLSTHYGFSMMDHFRFELNVNALGKEKLLKIDEIFKSRQKADEEAIQGQRIMAAVNKGDLDTVRKLINEGFSVNTSYPRVNSFLDGHTPLLVAARDGHIEIVRELLNAGADVSVEDWIFKGHPIHKATYNGNPEILKMLIEHPCIDIDIQGPINGYTPLHDALWHGYTECAMMLIEAGARLDLKGHDGKTPLDVAIDVYGTDSEVAKMISESIGGST